jgi:hypothetical protein
MAWQTLRAGWRTNYMTEIIFIACVAACGWAALGYALWKKCRACLCVRCCVDARGCGCKPLKAVHRGYMHSVFGSDFFHLPEDDLFRGFDETRGREYATLAPAHRLKLHPYSGPPERSQLFPGVYAPEPEQRPMTGKQYLESLKKAPVIHAITLHSNALLERIKSRHRLLKARERKAADATEAFEARRAAWVARYGNVPMPASPTGRRGLEAMHSSAWFGFSTGTSDTPPHAGAVEAGAVEAGAVEPAGARSGFPKEEVSAGAAVVALQLVGTAQLPPPPPPPLPLPPPMAPGQLQLPPAPAQPSGPVGGADAMPAPGGATTLQPQACMAEELPAPPPLPPSLWLASQRVDTDVCAPLQSAEQLRPDGVTFAAPAPAPAPGHPQGARATGAVDAAVMGRRSSGTGDAAETATLVEEIYCGGTGASGGGAVGGMTDEAPSLATPTFDASSTGGGGVQGTRGSGLSVETAILLPPATTAQQLRIPISETAALPPPLAPPPQAAAQLPPAGALPPPPAVPPSHAARASVLLPPPPPLLQHSASVQPQRQHPLPPPPSALQVLQSVAASAPPPLPSAQLLPPPPPWMHATVTSGTTVRNPMNAAGVCASGAGLPPPPPLPAAEHPPAARPLPPPTGVPGGMPSGSATVGPGTRVPQLHPVSATADGAQDFAFVNPMLMLAAARRPP